MHARCMQNVEIILFGSTTLSVGNCHTFKICWMYFKVFGCQFNDTYIENHVELPIHLCLPEEILCRIFEWDHMPHQLYCRKKQWEYVRIPYISRLTQSIKLNLFCISFHVNREVSSITSNVFLLECTDRFNFKIFGRLRESELSFHLLGLEEDLFPSLVNCINSELILLRILYEHMNIVSRLMQSLCLPTVLDCKKYPQRTIHMLNNPLVQRFTPNYFHFSSIECPWTKRVYFNIRRWSVPKKFAFCHCCLCH